MVYAIICVKWYGKYIMLCIESTLLAENVKWER